MRFDWTSVDGSTSLNFIQNEIGKWRRSKGFESPHKFEEHSHINEKLMLIVAELGEACEAVRKEDWSNFKEELADTIIRVLDLTDSLGIGITEEICKKMAINENRPYKHGKVC